MSEIPSTPGREFGNWAIKKYQKFVSNALADDRDYTCKYTPSCSHYGQDAIKEYGPGKGTVMAFMRMMRCHKTAEGGNDPVILKKDLGKKQDFTPAHKKYKYKTADEIFSYPSKRHKVSVSSETKESSPAEKPRGIRGYMKRALKTSFIAATTVLGGLAAAGLFTAVGAPLGAYLGHKAGKHEIDDVNAAIARKYSPESVYGFAKIETAVGKPAHIVNRFVEKHTGRKTLAKVAGAMMGGPTGLLLGAAKGAIKGYQTGAQYGRLLGTTLTKENPKNIKAYTPAPDIKLEEVSGFFKGKRSFELGGTRITPIMKRDVDPAYIAFIESAKKSIDIDLFSFKAPKMKDILLRKAREGVKIRVVTNLGGRLPSQKEQNKKILNELRNSGVDVKLYPAIKSFNQFNHSKMVIVDGKASAVGTRNWGYSFGNDDDFDILFFMTGDTVDEARTIFERDWKLSGGKPEKVEHADRSPNVRIIGNEPLRNDITREIKKSIKEAKKSIDVSIYWLTDKLVLKQLKNAKERDVNVRVLMANTPKNKGAYQYLNNAGIDVKVFVPPKTDKVRSHFHEKMTIFDDRKVIMGSCDWTPQALYMNRELNVAVDNRDMAAFMKGEFENDWQNLSAPDGHFEPRREDKLLKKKSLKDHMLDISGKMPGIFQKASTMAVGMLSLVKRRFV